MTPPACSADNDIAEAAWEGYRGARIMTVGRLKRVKNHALLIRAFAKVSEIQPARLMIVGDGELRDELEALIAELGLGGKVVLPGFVNDPTPLYRSADLFVLSSNYEGFGNVIVEAMACGVPVVSTDCPAGPSEILENGRFGTLVPVGDVDALASAMMSALQTGHDPEVLKRRAAAFAPEVAASKYLDLLFPSPEPRMPVLSKLAPHHD